MAKARVGFLIHSVTAGAFPTSKRSEQGRADGGEVVGERAWMVKLDWTLLSSFACEPAMQADRWREHLEAGVLQLPFREKPIVTLQEWALNE